MLVEKPVVLSARNNLLTMPGKPKEKHRLQQTLKILICKVSGKNAEVEDYHIKLQTLSAVRGEQEQQGRMTPMSRGGRNMLSKGISVPLVRL